MKNQRLKWSVTLLSLIAFTSSSLSSFAQTDNSYLGLPGDNLNLYAVMDIFQRSKTLEDFEREINLQDSKVNNLDLNNDGQTDYIKVMDDANGNAHTIVMQVDLGRNETQDIGVFYVDKKGSDVSIQLIGDEDLYGQNYIVEPNDDQSTGTANPGYRGNTTIVNNNYNTNNYYDDDYQTVQYAPRIMNWGIITFMYSNYYNPWRSPWYWGYYPTYWRPWGCYYWYDYNYHWSYNHRWNRGWYNRGHRHRFNHMHANYNQRRQRSTVYRSNKKQATYKNTYDGREKLMTNRNALPVGRTMDQSNSIKQRKTTTQDLVAPTTRPVMDNGRTTRPVTQPADTKTNIRQDQNTRPVTRPVENQPIQQPTTRPIDNRPIQQPNIRPVDQQRPQIQPASRQIERPQPASRPIENRPTQQPSKRPIENNRSSRSSETTHPSSRPMETTRPVSRPTERQPSRSEQTTRPSNSGQRSINR
jgi:hypothetical protein